MTGYDHLSVQSYDNCEVAIQYDQSNIFGWPSEIACLRLLHAADTCLPL